MMIGIARRVYFMAPERNSQIKIYATVDKKCGRLLRTSTQTTMQRDTSSF